MAFKRKKAIKIAIICIVFHFLLSFLATKFVYDSIFGRYDPPECTISDSSLTEIMDSVSFPSGENLLSGKLFDSPGDSLVVIVPGLRSHMGEFAPIIAELVQQYGRDVFIFDMTGCCESQGDSCLGFPQAVLDLNAALDYIDSAYDYEDIFLVGHSRGGYAVCCVLENRSDIDAAVSINSPGSPMDAVVGSSVGTVGWIAYGNYPILYLYQAMLFDFKSASQSAADAIANSDVPVLIIQAQQDETVRWDRFSICADKDQLSGSNAEFWLIHGGHSSVLYDETGLGVNGELWARINSFYNCN